MNQSDQGYAGYYDETLPALSTVGMGDFASFFGAGTQQNVKVTTNDPAPEGDLFIRSGPGSSYAQVGAAEKGGVMTILDVSDDGAWYQVQWNGGIRRPPAQGWASARFLTLTDEPVQPGPSVPVVPGVPVAPSAPSPSPGPYTPASSSTGPSRALLVGGAVAALVAGWYFLK